MAENDIHEAVLVSRGYQVSKKKNVIKLRTLAAAVLDAYPRG